MSQNSLDSDREYSKLEDFVALMGLLTACTVPLRLSWSYAALIPACLGALVLLWKKPKSFLRHDSDYSLLLFFFTALVLSLQSLHPASSAISLIRFFFLFLMLPVFRLSIERFSAPTLLLCLLASQCISSIDTIAQSIFPLSSKRYLVGEMSESGQIAISFFAALALLRFNPGDRLFKSSSELAPGVLLLLFFSSLCLPGNLLAAELRAGVALASIGFLSWSALQKLREDPKAAQFFFCCYLALPLLGTALLFNLKRGPILGLLMALFIWTLFGSRKRAVLILLTSLLAILFVEPLKWRFLASYEHFTISGGRGTIWDIGLELASRYPLGIGFDQSPLLQIYSAAVPTNLTHFHNNFLNLVVELGWLPGFLFFYWLLHALDFGRSFLSSKAALAFGLLAWQIAGCVEYNVGDTEVLLAALIFLAVISSKESFLAEKEKGSLEGKSFNAQGA